MKLTYKNFSIIFFNILVFSISLIIYLKFNIENFVLFSLIIGIYVSYTFYHWKYFFEIILCFFLFLGFWFKTIIHFIVIYPIQFVETSSYNFQLAKQDKFSNLFEELSVFFILLIIIIDLVKRIKLNIYLKRKDILSNYLYRKKIFLYITILSFLVVILNFQFDFAFRGQISDELYLEKIFKFFLILLFPFIFYLILDFVIKKIIFLMYYILPIICFTVLSYHSLNSRQSVIVLFIILFATYIFYKQIISQFINKKKINILIIILASLISVLSSIVVTNERNQSKNYSFEKNISRIFYLSTQRWVGIDSATNIIYSKEKRGIKFFINSLKDKKSETKKDYYIINYYQQENESEFKQKNRKYLNVYTPGLVSFILINDYFIVSAILIFLTILFLIFSEKTFFALIGKNYLAISFLVFLIVWRLIHFGLYPINTLIYFLLIFFLPISYYICNYFLAIMLKSK